MGADSKIEWTHHTFNPWWGCARVSPGCEHCYAEAFAKRIGKAKWGVKEERRFFGDKHWAEPLKWNKAAEKAGERRRVFCASMADVFEDRRDLEDQRDRLWSLIEDTPNLDWLLLTKRPENIAHIYPGLWLQEPRENVWLGVTVEDQKRADERIPHLIKTPARVRFLSCEPLLGPVDVESWLKMPYGPDWVIVGGESGPGARPFAVSWARSIIAQCRKADAVPFVKQMGAQPILGAAHDDGAFDGLVPLVLGDRRKGGEMSEWPSDIAVREFPVLA